MSAIKLGNTQLVWLNNRNCDDHLSRHGTGNQQIAVRGVRLASESIGLRCAGQMIATGFTATR